jgi:hypothetical protein
MRDIAGSARAPRVFGIKERRAGAEGLGAIETLGAMGRRGATRILGAIGSLGTMDILVPVGSRGATGKQTGSPILRYVVGPNGSVRSPIFVPSSE